MRKNIRNFILKNLNDKNKKIKIRDNISLFNQNFDSLDFLKLIFKIEKKYKLKIESKKFEQLNTINNLIKYVEKNEK